MSRQHHTKVTGMLDRAAKKGFVAYGHKKRELQLEDQNKNGCYVSPTVLINVPESDEVWRDEVFGPVTAITKFSSEEEVISRANDTTYG